MKAVYIVENVPTNLTGEFKGERNLLEVNVKF